MGNTWIVDVEASGKYPTSANLLQVAALKFSDRLEDWKLYNWYINPRSPIPFEVKNLTGLDEEYLREQSDGLYFEEVCEDIQETILQPGDLLVGHNIKKYDSVVIKNNFSRAGIKLRDFPDMYDTMLEAKNLSFVHSGKWIKLGELFNMACEHYNVNSKLFMDTLLKSFDFNEHELQAHNAKYDVLVNGLLYRLMRINLGDS